MMNINKYLPKDAKPLINGNIVSFEISISKLNRTVTKLHSNVELKLKLIDATDERVENGYFKIWYIFASSEEDLYVVPYILLKQTEEFPSITSIIQAAGNYERKIHTMFGLKPVGHPDLRMLILHENWPADKYPLRKDFDIHERPQTEVSTYQYQTVKGEGVYEIPVGPIHAGIIEPGHFRFSVAGESIMLLEARLGYVHKGHEKLFENLSLPDQIRLSQKVSGDSSFSHSLAFCQAVEKLAGIAVPKRAEFLRTIYAELERLACHFGDIGFILMDTGYSVGGSNGSRLREFIMQINERLTGNRFLRDVNIVGGTTKDISEKQRLKLSLDIKEIIKDFNELINIVEDSVSVLNRLKNTGPLPPDVARDYGAVGVPARAVGISTDVRSEHPYAAYSELMSEGTPTEKSGDVYSRFCIRVKEANIAANIIQSALSKLDSGQIQSSSQKIKLKKNSFAISCVEGWRGEILYLIVTDKKGQISRVMVRDPSFINWQLVGYCAQDQIIPDFPLINKSFNLSYSGHDL